MENTDTNTNDGFAAFDALATSITTEPMPPAPVKMVPIAEPVIEAPLVADEVPAEPKVDRRKGERKVQNVDGSVSYGLKADGTPRKKPGRKPKAINAA